MSYFDVYKKGIKLLNDNNIEDSEFDAMCLIEKAFGISRTDYFLLKNSSAPDEKRILYFELIKRRVLGEPLQYILGEWEFMDYKFCVGSGVLIPRQDTELLVETAIDFINRNNVKTVIDLCSGSGCIGITVALKFPQIDVYCLELSKEALFFLKKNAEMYSLNNLHIICGDLKHGYDFFNIPIPEVILSNPPYIKSEDILDLQREVQEEPRMALDGGKDGYDYYHIICDKWIPFLKADGLCAVECGEGQAEKISEMFSFYSDIIEIYKDLNNIDRTVVMIKKGGK